MELFSPAKINLFLRVLKRRADGYHDLASLFQAIDLGDTISFAFNDLDELTCSDPSVPLGPANLITQAIALFRKKTALCTPMRVHLEKKIPMQAGLGGGSSNAATTLWALNLLHNKPATVEQLRSWSSEIGSDIPFFFSSGTAYCTGRGENVFSIDPLEQTEPYFFVKPSDGLSTPEIFRRLDLSSCSTIDPSTLLERAITCNPLYVNDLEKPAFEALPALKALKAQLLDAGFKQAVMTGSGTGFFCIGRGAYRATPIKFLSRKADRWYIIDHSAMVSSL